MSEALPTPEDLHGHIAFYRQLGWCVIPAAPSGVGSDGKPRGKAPIVDWKLYEKRLPTDAEYEEWLKRYWSGSNPCNIALVCGTVSGNLVALDFDSIEAYRRFFAKREELERSTIVVKSSPDHRYVYFYTHNPVKSRKWLDLKVELHGEGTVMILPPSIHPPPNTHRYEFANPQVTEVATDPNLEQTVIRKIQEMDGAVPSEGKPWGEGKVDWRSHTYEGPTPACIELLLNGVNAEERKDAAFRLASFYFNMKHWGLNKVHSMLEEWNQRNLPEPLSQKELNESFSLAEDKGYIHGCDDTLLKRRCVNPEICELNKHGDLPQADLTWDKLERITPAFDVLEGSVNPGEPHLCITVPQVVRVKEKVKGKDEWVTKKKVMPVLFFDDRRRYLADDVTFTHFNILNYSPPDPPENRWGEGAIERWLEGTYPPPDKLAVYRRLKEEFMYYLDCIEAGMYYFIPLFNMGTYFFQHFAAFPIVGVVGPKASGKSKILKWSSCVAWNAEWSSDLTESSVFRTSQDAKATLLIDEAEGLSDPDKRQALRSVLNASFEKGSVAKRTNKQTGRQERFDVFGAKVVAGIQGFEDVLESRMLPFVILRTVSEKGNREIDLKEPKWQQLRDDLYYLMMMEWREVKSIYDGLADVKGLQGRNWQLWKPMLALAKWLGDPHLYGKMLELAMRKTAYRGAKDQFGADEALLLKTLGDLVVKDGWYSLSEIKEKMSEGYEADEVPVNLTTTYVGQLLMRMHWLTAKKWGGRLRHRITKGEVRDRMERYGVLKEEVEQ